MPPRLATSLRPSSALPTPAAAASRKSHAPLHANPSNPAPRHDRYPLFFQQLLKAVPKEDENYAQLQKANDMVCEVSRCVDESLEMGVQLQALLEPLGAEYMQAHRALGSGFEPPHTRPLAPARLLARASRHVAADVNSAAALYPTTRR